MYGIHINSDEDIITNIKKAHKYGCTVIQLFAPTFVKLNELIDKILQLTNKYKMQIVCHASYTINIATNWFKTAWHIQELLTELEISKKMNAMLVLHMGKQKELTKETAYNNMLSSLIYVIKKTNGIILLETPAGQGTEMCSNLEDMTYFFNKIKRNPILQNNVGLCLDTCHVFVSGYDIASQKKSESFLNKFNEVLKNVKCVHLNDSYNECGSKLDRHNDFGNGFIGKEALSYLFHYFEKLNIPIIFETTFKSLDNLFS